MAAGYANWVHGDYSLNSDHPPLLQKLSALPLLFVELRAPDPAAPRYQGSPNPRPTYGYDLFFASGNDPLRLARLARAPIAILGVGLLLCVYGWGRELLGRGPALLATAVASLCPNLIGHAKLATEDLGCSALVFAAVWMLWRLLQGPGAGRAAAGGLVVGLALLSKYSALLLAPISALLLAVAWRRGDPPLRWAPLAILAGVALGVVSLGYGARLRPDLFVAGIFRIYPDVDPSYAFYLLGRASEEPFRLHGWVSLLLKVPLPTWGLLALGLGVALRSERPERLAFLLAPPALFLLASSFDITNPGIRRVLPALPFLLLLSAYAARGAPGRLRGGLIAGLLAWLALEALWTYPHHLSYLNALAGGTPRGPYVFDESNIDWGQDLPALAAWQRETAPDQPLWLRYFGGADPAAYGVRARPMPDSAIETPPPGLYAVSTHYLAQFRKLAQLRGADSDWLSRFTPIARPAPSIWIYRHPDPGSARSTLR